MNASNETTAATADVWDRAAALYEGLPRRWPSPAALACELDPQRKRTPALDLIDQALVDVVDGKTKKLIVCVPPQEGKSTLTSHAFPRWLLTHRPDTRIVLVSYERETATRWARAVREDIATYNGEDDTLDLGLRVRSSDRRADRWTLEGHAGGIYAAGIGSALTGRSADLIIIDDPLRDMEQAQSSVYRERAWNWWQSVARTRFGPDTAAVIVSTRWHSEDLVGKLLAAQPDEWTVVSIPAIADSPDDPLGREIDEPMISARGRTLAEWKSIERDVGPYVWASLYQQRPAPLAGGLYKRDRFRYWRPSATDPWTGEGADLMSSMYLELGDPGQGRRHALRDTQRFAVADLAASVKTSADYTVIAVFAITNAGDIVILDLHRERMTPDKHLDAAKPMVQRWGAWSLYVEEMFHSATLVYDAARSGIPVTPLKPDKDKVTRALAATARVEQGKVYLPEGAAWVPAFLDELSAFPNGARDDQADVLSYAATIAAKHWLAPMSADEERAIRRVDPYELEHERAMDAVFGPPVDFLNAPLF